MYTDSDVDTMDTNTKNTTHKDDGEDHSQSQHHSSSNGNDEELNSSTDCTPMEQRSSNNDNDDDNVNAIAEEQVVDPNFEDEPEEERHDKDGQSENKIKTATRPSSVEVSASATTSPDNELISSSVVLSNDIFNHNRFDVENPPPPQSSSSPLKRMQRSNSFPPITQSYNNNSPLFVQNNNVNLNYIEEEENNDMQSSSTQVVLPATSPSTPTNHHINDRNSTNNFGNNSYSLFNGQRGIRLPPSEDDEHFHENNIDNHHHPLSEQALRIIHSDQSSDEGQLQFSHYDNQTDNIEEGPIYSNNNSHHTQNNNNNNNISNSNNAINNHQDQNRIARMRWILINRRLQMIIKTVKGFLTFVFLGIVICWFIFTAEYVVSFDEEVRNCESIITTYYWLATFQLFHDVFRNEILRYFLCWNPRSTSRSRDVPTRIYIFNLFVMTYAIIVLRIGIILTFLTPIDDNECISTSLFRAAKAHVLFNAMAWFLIVFGYIIPFVIALILLTRNGYTPGLGVDNGLSPRGAGQFGGIISLRSNHGAPLGTADLMKTIQYEVLSEEHPRDCCICMGDFSSDDEIVLTECNHIFHKTCCEEWLNHACTCPVCRQDIPSTVDFSFNELLHSPSTTSNGGTVTEMFGRRGLFPSRDDYQSIDPDRRPSAIIAL